jgi:hypothetical protein
MTPRERLTPKKSKLPSSPGEGMTNREIGRFIGTTEQVTKNHLRSTFDKQGVWSRLELAMYVASHGAKNWPEPEASVVKQAFGFVRTSSLEHKGCKTFLISTPESTLRSW